MAGKSAAYSVKKRIWKPMKTESNPKGGTPKNHSFDTTNLPKDVIFGVPLVTITGNLELYIENYKSLIEYTDRIIRIKRREGEIRISGENLQIAYYKTAEMKITGRIRAIEYL